MVDRSVGRSVGRRAKKVPPKMFVHSFCRQIYWLLTTEVWKEIQTKGRSSEATYTGERWSPSSSYTQLNYEWLDLKMASSWSEGPEMPTEMANTNLARSGQGDVNSQPSYGAAKRKVQGGKCLLWADQKVKDWIGCTRGKKSLFCVTQSGWHLIICAGWIWQLFINNCSSCKFDDSELPSYFKASFRLRDSLLEMLLPIF